MMMTAILLFIGGFYTGVKYSNFKMQQAEMPKKQKTAQAPYSAKKPTPKQKLKTEQEKSKVLIGYVQDFRDPASIDYSKLTHVIFSFAHPEKDGSVLLNGDMALTNLQATVQQAKQAHTKVLLAVGGWYHISGGESYEYFKTAIGHSDSRSKLINELMGIVEREKLDGIDIDFEHPRSQEDAQNLTAFTKGLSERLQTKDKELTIAVSSKVHSVTGTEFTSVVYEPTMFKYVDHVNIMAYDGQWDGEYNAGNLSAYPFTQNSVGYWTNLFEKHGISKEKLVLGVPFYAQPEDPAIKQISYATIIQNHPEKANQDKVAMNGTIYHYNGRATIQKKTKLALEKGFGGMMFWEAGHDAKTSYSLTNAILEVLEKENIK
jgi:chitinase